MSNFVLDNSVAMRWLLKSAKVVDQHYAESVLKAISNHEVTVPNLWHLEATNFLLGGIKRGEIGEGEVENFIAQLENLPIYIDPLTSHKSFNRTMNLARAHKLSSYDAAYLELAVREGLPLATLDKDLTNAATQAGVPLFLK